MDRVKAYNGVCTKLVTGKGESIPAATGTMRAGAPLLFPHEDHGRFEFSTESGSVCGTAARVRPNGGDRIGSQRQTAVRHGRRHSQRGPTQRVRNAEYSRRTLGHVQRQVRCTARGRRFPQDAPAACEKFRQQPDALELAAELDAQYGRSPDLEKLPMYCTVITVKNWYDVKDMRSTGGNDVNYAKDFAPWDMTIVGQLRDKGAIISGITIASEANFDSTATRAEDGVRRRQRIRSSWGGDAAIPMTPNAPRAAAAAAPAHRSQRTWRPVRSAKRPAAPAAYRRTPTRWRASSPPRA